ncbi:xylulokinase [Stenomitos frigidus]|uniref:Xylulose kinase n=1 Tax=Stenomitos frigidus ULC18 TaxID=2107698 RepID=A0A2T1ES74_9CYAN|nr:xylulokinase [Stenomitos frigidus]PSB35585.1 xylulokinase [Stenomitos frigidus ULC18]
MLLGIDLGTGSVKALLLAIDGTVIAEASHAYTVRSPQPGWAEIHPAEWWEAVAIVVRTVMQGQGDHVQAIGLSGQMHGVVLADAKGEPLRPAILWADTRSSQVLERYRTLAPNLLQLLANPITTGMAGATLLWLQLHEPAVYTTARWALQPKDWLRFRLTGTVATEPSDASGTLLYDLLADEWAIEVLDALHLRADWLPTLVPSTSIAGALTVAAAKNLGLPPGLPVITGAADTAAAMLGSGLLSPGTMQLTVGSGAQIVTPRSQPIADPHRRTHLYHAALPNQWYTLAAMQNAGLALDWVRNLFGFSWQQVYADAFSVAPGCEGLTFLPYLTGERTPHLDPIARGAWVGLGLHHGRSHLMRSALEGVAFSLKQGLAAIAATGVNATTLQLAGGGTLEPAWRQLLADVLQLPLYSVTVAAASARGAALLAGIGSGVYADANDVPPVAIAAHPTSPRSLDVRLSDAWERYQSLYPHLHCWREHLR